MFRVVLCAVLSLCFLPQFSWCNEKPNVVLIVADDLGFGELGCYGQEKIRTPNIDKLAFEGMRFTRHYSGAPVCAPARCTLMTGLHTGHAQIRGNKQWKAKPTGPEEQGQTPITDNTVTLAEHLKANGYVTGAFGKWGLGAVGSEGAPHKQGFDLFYGYNCQAVAHSYFPPYLWRNGELVPLNEKPIPSHTEVRDTEDVRLMDYQGEKYAPDFMMAEAVQFIEENKSSPFFLYLPFIEPHVAMQPPPALVDSYPAEWDPIQYRGESSYLPHPRPRAGYAAMITSLDEHVGKIVAKLDEVGVLENTLIIFTSDNGTTLKPNPKLPFGVGGVDPEFFNSTRGLRGLKGSVYEGGIRVPFIVRWPGRVEAGTTSEAVTYFPDHFPTICAALGLPGPGKTDGVDMTPVWFGKQKSVERKPMVWAYPEYTGQFAVRIGDFKVVRMRIATRKPADWEVYNLVEDPNEQNNLASTRADLIDEARKLFESEVGPNDRFPLSIDGISPGTPNDNPADLVRNKKDKPKENEEKK